MIDNVFVDGFNLAYRCLYAPGMSDMQDSKRRPTGVLFGTLRVLMSMLKKFPGAKLHVVWDGSSRTRKDRFADYKANRTNTSIAGVTEDGQPWDQIKWLRETLPLLGVSQVYNPFEEADDVLATLVRGRHKGQQNIILSTDQDLLQLITDTDRLLVPTQGKRREAIYDLEKLKEEWGVGPELIVSLRALLGDTSDNIPGVPTVPEKVLTSLLVRHGSIDGIYNSNMAGLTKLRYRLLLESEKQVRLNLELMTLRDVTLTDIPSAPDADAATERLEDVDVQFEPVLASLLGVQAIVDELITEESDQAWSDV
jgi:DNA polymerase-1